MGLNFSLVALILVVLVIFTLLVFKKFRHKILVLLLIGLILFFYFGFSFITKENNIQLNSVPGIFEAGKLYVSWLVSVTSNLGQITANAIGMDWFNKNKIEEINRDLFNSSIAN